MNKTPLMGRVLSPFLTTNARGHSLMELLGVITIILTLGIIAMPSYLGTTTAAKEGIAQGNASMLNSAIEQYNQAGGLMTAQVPMQVNGTVTDGELAEVQVLCRLATSGNNFKSGLTGPFIAPYQNPVISRSPTDYRVIWLSGVKSGDSLASVAHGASGLRNSALEKALADGSVEPGRFVVVGPSLYAQYGVSDTIPGIVAMSKDGLSCGDDIQLKGPDINGMPGDEVGDPTDPVPTPAVVKYDPNTVYTIQLGVSPAGSGVAVPAGAAYQGGSVANYSVVPAKGYRFRNWGGDLIGQAASGSIVIDGNKVATAYMEPGEQTLNLQAIPPTGGSVSGFGAYPSGSSASYSAQPQPGWIFVGWSGGITSAAPTGTIVMDGDYSASALFAPENCVVLLDKGVGGTTTPEPKRFELMLGDRFHVEAIADFDPAWGKDRYRWESYRVDYGEGFGEENRYKTFRDQLWDFKVDGSVTILPQFVKQFYVVAEPNVAGSGTIELSPAPSAQGLYDAGTVVTVTARPSLRFGLRGWIAEGATESEKNPSWDADVVSKTFTVYGDTRITADFARIWTLTVTSLKPELGKVAVGASEISELAVGQTRTEATFIDGSTAYIRGVGIKYGYKVSRWTGSLSGNANPATLLMNGDKTVIADFGLRDFHLTVRSEGNGYSGITGDYRAFTTPPVVQLAHPDWTFTGWIGDAYMDKDKTVTASFRQIWFYVTYGNIHVDTDSHPGANAWFTGGTGRYREGNNVTISMNWKQLYDSHKDGDATRPKNKDSDKKMSVALVNFAGQSKETGWGNTGGSATFTMPAQNVVVTGSWYCPVVIDMDGDGQISLLSGGDWKKDRPEPLNKLAMRSFDLDGTGLKLWEWIGPKDGLLVWDPKQTSATPTGKQLFGHDAFGKKWANGYDALASLDKNKDRILTGNELRGISVWVDENSNGLVDAGEMRTLETAGITSISVQPNILPDGNAHIEGAGAVLNGKPISSWDWYSRSK